MKVSYDHLKSKNSNTKIARWNCWKVLCGFSPFLSSSSFSGGLQTAKTATVSTWPRSSLRTPATRFGMETFIVLGPRNDKIFFSINLSWTLLYFKLIKFWSQYKIILYQLLGTYFPWPERGPWEELWDERTDWKMGWLLE